ncbi:MAG: polymer-forming cytoskeletal protein [Pseudohongiellaceae bacterium]
MFDRKNESRESSESSTPVSSAPSPAESRPAASGGAKAAIGATIRIKGDVSGDENLLIEGKVEGTVSLASHELVIGKSGKVHADITAKLIRIDGEVQGDITGKEKVIISATGNVRGNIVTPRMSLEDGAKFKGSIDMDPASSGEKTAGASQGGSPQTGSGKSSSENKASTP